VGTGDPGATVTITNNGGQPLCVALVDAQGMWRCDLAQLPEGVTVVTVTIVDAVGNTAVIGGGLVAVDTTPPALTLDSPVAGPTADPAPIISGTAEPGAEITVIIDGQVVGSAVAGADGMWSYTPAAPLGAGMHSIIVEARDAAGNVSTEDVTITIVMEDMGVDMGADMAVADMGADMEADMDAADMDISGDMSADMAVVADMGADMSAPDSDLVLTGGCAQAAGQASGQAPSAPLWLAALGLLAWRRRRA
jgi:MYXO-CTERM domain-containing protein